MTPNVDPHEDSNVVDKPRLENHTAGSPWSMAKSSFASTDRGWVRIAVVMMSVLGLSKTAQMKALHDVRQVREESGERCQELYGDPVSWALSLGQSSSAHSPEDDSALGANPWRMPAHAHWPGRFWYAFFALLFWSIIAPAAHLGWRPGQPIEGTVAVVGSGVVLYAVMWGMFLWKYEGPKYFDEPGQNWTETVAGLTAAVAIWGLWSWTSDIYLWSGTFPAWCGFLVSIPAVLGMWLLRKVGRRSWPTHRVSQSHWRSIFLGFMNSRRLYRTRTARAYLRELEADAAQLAASQGKTTDLNDLGPAHLVAAGFDRVDPFADPERLRAEHHHKRVSDVVWLVIGGVVLTWTVIQGWLSAGGAVFFAALCALFTWANWRRWRREGTTTQE